MKIKVFLHGTAIMHKNALGRAGAEICYLGSHRKPEEVENDQAVLRKYGFPDNLVFFRRAGERYENVAEHVLPDVLVEDDCERIGSETEMTYPHLKLEMKVNLKSVVFQEFGGIDLLPDDVSALVNC